MLTKSQYAEYLEAGLAIDSLPLLTIFVRAHATYLVKLFLDLQGVAYEEVDREMLVDIQRKLYQPVDTHAEFEDKILQTLGNIHGVFLMSDIDPQANMATRCLEKSVTGLCSFARYTLDTLRD